MKPESELNQQNFEGRMRTMGILGADLVREVLFVVHPLTITI